MSDLDKLIEAIDNAAFRLSTSQGDKVTNSSFVASGGGAQNVLAIHIHTPFGRLPEEVKNFLDATTKQIKAGNIRVEAHTHA